MGGRGSSSGQAELGSTRSGGDRLTQRIRGAPSYRNGPYTESDKVSPTSLGLKFDENTPQNITDREYRRNIPLSKIILGRDSLVRERLVGARGLLANGFKVGKGIQDIHLAQRPDGRYQVLGDGNHRIAIAQLTRMRGNVPALVRLQRKPKKKK